jgi:hypothetical protein
MITSNSLSTNAHIRRDVGLSDYQEKPIKKRGLKSLVKSVKIGIRNMVKKVVCIAQPLAIQYSAGL